MNSRCCRAHDLCPFKIRKLSTAFGLVNTRPHTALHCGCDESFRTCLQVQPNLAASLLKNSARKKSIHKKIYREILLIFSSN